MTESNKDPEEWRAVIGNKRHKDELAKKFKDNDSPLKIAIVVDMWLTGFDVPSLATMYVYKPMKGYNLMQAIARVNRVLRVQDSMISRISRTRLPRSLQPASALFTWETCTWSSLSTRAYPCIGLTEKR